jgi:hypothetical protein
MSVTDTARVNLFDRRVLADVDFDDRLLDFLEVGVLRHTKGMTTGGSPTTEVGAWYLPVGAVDGAGVNDLTFTSMYGVDGGGEFISVDAGDSRITDVPFEDAAVTYYMATRVAEVPVGIQVDTEAGIQNYDYHRKDIGHRAEPTVVVDGGGFITLTLGNHDLDGADDFTGRTAIVFLKSPVATDASVAIETVTVSGTTATTAGTLGQSTVSTTASDYEVVLLGPTITRDSTLSTRPGWAFIGTVVGGGAPRVFDTTTLVQPQLVPLSDLSAQATTILEKGWVSVPTVTVTGGGSTINVTTTGSVFTAGRVLSAPTTSFTGLTPTTEQWVTYNPLTGLFQLETGWDTADSGVRVPLYWFVTDGGGLITASESVSRRVERFPDSVLLTLSQESLHHGAFRSVGEALHTARSIQTGVAIPPKGIEIEVIGDVSLSATITDANLFDVVNVRFRGRSSGLASRVNSGLGTAGARLTWALDAPFFQVPATASILSWAFENLAIQYTGTATADTVAFVSNPAGAITGLLFERVIVDGNTVAVDNGGGALPHLVYSANGTVSDLALIDCNVYTRDAVVSVTAAGDALSNFKALRVDVANDASPLFATSGLVSSESIGPDLNWRITDCTSDDIRGTIIRARYLQRAWMRGNHLNVQNFDATVLDIGETTTNSDRLWITDNLVERAFTGPSGPLVHLKKTGGTDRARWFLYGNNFADGDDTNATGDTCVRLQGSSAGNTVNRAAVFGNYIEGARFGFDVTSNVGQILLFGNHIEAGDEAYGGPSAASGTNFNLVTGNSIEATNATGVAFGVRLRGTEAIFAGNLIQSAGDEVVSISSVSGSNNVFAGNQIRGGTVNSVENGGEGNVFAGNRMTAGYTTTGVPTGTIFVGNKVTGDYTGAAEEQSVILGNNVTGDQIRPGSGGGHVVVGNYADSVDLDFYDPPNTAVVGNVTFGTTAGDFNTGTGDHVAAVGNVSASGGVTINGNEHVVVGNVLYGASGFTLSATSVDVAVIGNYILAASITDGGTTGSVFQTATDGDPLNTFA